MSTDEMPKSLDAPPADARDTLRPAPRRPFASGRGVSPLMTALLLAGGLFGQRAITPPRALTVEEARKGLSDPEGVARGQAAEERQKRKQERKAENDRRAREGSGQ